MKSYDRTHWRKTFGGGFSPSEMWKKGVKRSFFSRWKSKMDVLKSPPDRRYSRDTMGNPGSMAFLPLRSP